MFWFGQSMMLSYLAKDHGLCLKIILSKKVNTQDTLKAILITRIKS